MSRLAQGVATAVREMKVTPRRLRMADGEQGGTAADAATAATAEGADDMATKTKEKKEKKVREKKPKPERKASAPREGKKGLLLVTKAGIPLVVRGLKMLLADGGLSAGEQETCAQLAARAETRM